MIPFLTVILVVSILLLTMIQTILVVNYRWFVRDNTLPSTDVEIEDSDLAKSAIILCLRGYELGTADCLAELVGQIYPDFELHIAFDSESDPAVTQVKEFFENHKSKAQLHYFSPLPKCSYKCSAIAHVVGELDESIEFVAFCDGDAIVDEYWLRDLVVPMLSDKRIGATTGNRWFSPVDVSNASLVRKHWNAAAVVQMQAYDIAWGGSMAIRKSVIEKCGLVDRWSKSFCEDTLLASALKKHGLKLHRVANLVIENNEGTNLRECFSWIVRQLLTVKLHHSHWPLVMLHGVSTGIATIVTPIAAVALFASGNLLAGRSVLFAWIVYQLANIILLTLIGIANRTAMKHRNSAIDDKSLTTPTLTELVVSGLLVQVLHPLAVLKTMVLQSVKWRDVCYRIAGRHVRVQG